LRDTISDGFIFIKCLGKTVQTTKKRVINIDFGLKITDREVVDRNRGKTEWMNFEDSYLRWRQYKCRIDCVGKVVSFRRVFTGLKSWIKDRVICFLRIDIYGLREYFRLKSIFWPWKVIKFTDCWWLTIEESNAT